MSIQDERTKLTATFFNGLAIASVAVGFISPTVTAQSGAQLGLRAFLAALVWLLVGFALHFLARAVLRRLSS